MNTAAISVRALPARAAFCGSKKTVAVRCVLSARMYVHTLAATAPASPPTSRAAGPLVQHRVPLAQAT